MRYHETLSAQATILEESRLMWQKIEKERDERIKEKKKERREMQGKLYREIENIEKEIAVRKTMQDCLTVEAEAVMEDETDQELQDKIAMIRSNLATMQHEDEEKENMERLHQAFPCTLLWGTGSG